MIGKNPNVITAVIVVVICLVGAITGSARAMQAPSVHEVSGFEVIAPQYLYQSGDIASFRLVFSNYDSLIGDRLQVAMWQTINDKMVGRKLNIESVLPRVALRYTGASRSTIRFDIKNLVSRPLFFDFTFNLPIGAVSAKIPGLDAYTLCLSVAVVKIGANGVSSPIVSKPAQGCVQVDNSASRALGGSLP